VDALKAHVRVRVLVQRGAGDNAFVSGADISQFDAIRDSPQASEAYEDIGNLAMARVSTCSKPTTGMLQGWCLGGGMAIALNCDLRIADDSLRFGIPAARRRLALDRRQEAGRNGWRNPRPGDSADRTPVRCQ